MNLDASVRVIYDSLQCSMVEDYYSSIIHLVFVVQIIASICFHYIVGPLQWMVVTHLETSQTLATVVSDQIVKDLISKRTTMVLFCQELFL